MPIYKNITILATGDFENWPCRTWVGRVYTGKVAYQPGAYLQFQLYETIRSVSTSACSWLGC